MEPEEPQKAEVEPLLDIGTLPVEEPEEGVYRAYANLVNMNWTLTDVQIRFGELVQIPTEDAPTWGKQQGAVIERVSVTLPWHQAKVLHDLLTGLIASYEELNGELKAPKLAAPLGSRKI